MWSENHNELKRFSLIILFCNKRSSRRMSHVELLLFLLFIVSLSQKFLIFHIKLNQPHEDLMVFEADVEWATGTENPLFWMRWVPFRVIRFCRWQGERQVGHLWQTLQLFWWSKLSPAGSELCGSPAIRGRLVSTHFLQFGTKSLSKSHIQTGRKLHVILSCL